jgi:hypothetical protein
LFPSTSKKTRLAWTLGGRVAKHLPPSLSPLVALSKRSAEDFQLLVEAGFTQHGEDPTNNNTKRPRLTRTGRVVASFWVFVSTERISGTGKWRVRTRFPPRFSSHYRILSTHQLTGHPPSNSTKVLSIPPSSLPSLTPPTIPRSNRVCLFVYQLVASAFDNGKGRTSINSRSKEITSLGCPTGEGRRSFNRFPLLRRNVARFSR